MSAQNMVDCLFIQDPLSQEVLALPHMASNFIRDPQIADILTKALNCTSHNFFNNLMSQSHQFEGGC